MFDLLYKKYGINIVWWSSWIEPEILYVFEKYWAMWWDNILDVGCGYSKIAEKCIRKNKRYLWIDISSIPIDYNIKKFASNNISFLTSSIIDFQYEDRFDCIIDIGCLHCIDTSQHMAILLKYDKLLQSGGYICIRFFENNEETPLFFIDNVPIWWVSRQKILSFIKNKYTLIEEIKDTTQFDLCVRSTYILQKK